LFTVRGDTGSQTDPRGRIDPSRLHAALDVERKLSTQEQILGLDRLARSKGEPQPPPRFSRQLDQNPRDRDAWLNTHRGRRLRVSAAFELGRGVTRS
jgi:hypothetical protein